MRIVEKTPEYLALRLTRRGMHTTICVLDRARNAATIVRIALIIPYFRRRVPLSHIRDVAVRRSGGRSAYRTALRLGFDSAVTVGEFTKDEALEVAKAIRDFLKENRLKEASAVPTVKDEAIAGTGDRTSEAPRNEAAAVL
jgi:hypothetical protein